MLLSQGNCLQLCFQPSRSFFFSYNVANESWCSGQCDVIIIYSFKKVATAVILINYGEFFCSIIVFIKNMFTHLQTYLFIGKKYSDGNKVLLSVRSFFAKQKIAPAGVPLRPYF